MSQPSVWKMNLAWDGELPFFGLEVGAEWLHTRVNKGLHYQPPEPGRAHGQQRHRWPRAVLERRRWASASPAGRVAVPAITNGCATPGVARRCQQPGLRQRLLLVAPTDKGSGNAVTLSVSQRLGRPCAGTWPTRAPQ
jgi:hypothetical protein